MFVIIKHLTMTRSPGLGAGCGGVLVSRPTSATPLVDRSFHLSPSPSGRQVFPPVSQPLCLPSAGTDKGQSSQAVILCT